MEKGKRVPRQVEENRSLKRNLTLEQAYFLEGAYFVKKNPSKHIMEKLASHTMLTVEEIVTWFADKRLKASPASQVTVQDEIPVQQQAEAPIEMAVGVNMANESSSNGQTLEINACHHISHQSDNLHENRDVTQLENGSTLELCLTNYAADHIPLSPVMEVVDKCKPADEGSEDDALTILEKNFLEEEEFILAEALELMQNESEGEDPMKLKQMEERRGVLYLFPVVLSEGGGSSSKLPKSVPNEVQKAINMGIDMKKG